MNKMVKRGFSAYKIFLKNRIASSVMMLYSGIMMFIAALNGKGNDTKSLPLMIAAGGIVLSIWAFYRLGYAKSESDRISKDQRQEKAAARKTIIFQILESSAYLLVAALGIFLLINESFTNKVLDLMAGFFTCLNGVFGAINIYKGRDNKDFVWKLTIVLTVLEVIIGPIFLFASNSIDLTGYTIMGCLTMVAGTVEVIKALTKENLKATIADSKEIVHIIKDKEDEE